MKKPVKFRSFTPKLEYSKVVVQALVIGLGKLWPTGNFLAPKAPKSFGEVFFGFDGTFPTDSP
jgi:hypothetical protein